MEGKAGQIAVALALLAAGCLEPSAGPARSLEESAGAGFPDAAPTHVEPAPPRTPAPEPQSGPLRVHVVNVGQGDGTIWELPDGSLVVYDCGESAASADANPMVRKLRALGKPAGSRIHALVASHGHLDHVGGCEEILAEYEVTHLYEAWYDGADAPASYTRFRDQLKAEGGTLHTLRETVSAQGEEVLRQWDTLELPASTGVRAQLVWPGTFSARDWDHVADSSLVVRLVHQSVGFCFQGDIEAAQENVLASYAEDLSCDVLLVGHHGSKHASSTAWLAKTDPEHAVVSFGENPYGHPTSEALCRVQSAGARLYATHRAGDVTFTSDGTAVTTSASAETLDYCAPGVSYWGEPPAPAAQPTAQPTPAAEPPPAPPPAPAQPSGPTAPFSVSASVSDPNPCRYTTVTVHVHAAGANGVPVAGASVESSWHYKTTTSHESGATNANGDASLSRGISGATAGYTVRVDVTVTLDGASGASSTEFTPQTC